MRKVEMAQRIAEEMEITKGQADAAVEAILAAVKDALRQGEAVTLRVPARRVVRFTAGKVLKQAVTGIADAVG
jgi:nucleoid DNA-binding protein